MERWTMAVPCLFGLEGLVGDELRRMGMEDVRVEDRRVFFTGGAAELARANIGLRMGERVMILLARFPARSFEELYQGVKAIPLERFVPREGAFPVKGYSLDSQLHSVPDCQSIVKKAAVDHLGAHYGLTWLPETGETYQLRFSIMKDLCEVFLDSSGVSLHKRGYRAVGNEAPLHETMAAAMVNLARYRGRDFFWDPFCGSGTIVIEAALAALNRAPGLARKFAAQSWSCIPEDIWTQAREAARAAQVLVEADGLAGEPVPTLFGAQVDLRDEEAVRLGLDAPSRVAHGAAILGGAQEPVLVSVLGHVALDSFEALELLHHVIGLGLADEGGPVLVPDLAGERRQGGAVLGRFDGDELDGHAVVLSLACPFHYTATVRAAIVPAVRFLRARGPVLRGVFPFGNGDASRLLKGVFERVNSCRSRLGRSRGGGIIECVNR